MTRINSPEGIPGLGGSGPAARDEVLPIYITSRGPRRMGEPGRLVIERMPHPEEMRFAVYEPGRRNEGFENLNYIDMIEKVRTWV